MMAMTSRLVQLCAALTVLGACVQNGAYDPSAASTGAAASSSTSTGEATVSPTSSGPASSTSDASGSEGATDSVGGSSTTTGSVTGASTLMAGTSTGESTGLIDSSSDGGESTVAGSTGPECADPPEDMCEVDPMLPAYRICERITTWEEARVACEARCMRLVVLDEAESDQVYAVLRGRMTQADKDVDAINGDINGTLDRSSWWIGGHKQGGQFVWVDGAPMPPGGTMGWSFNNPDLGADTACVVLAVFGKGTTNSEWFDRDCATPPHRFVCEPLP